jgi:hypothetical protein
MWEGLHRGAENLGLKAFVAAGRLADLSPNDIVSKMMSQNKVPTNAEFAAS